MEKKGVFNTLIEQLMALPGVGKKTAERYAFFILKMPEEQARTIATAITDAKDKLRHCKICNNMTEAEVGTPTAVCKICANGARDPQKILVVEEANTLYAIEKSGEYKGLYHVLHGTYSPLSDNGHEGTSASINGLMERIKQGMSFGISEVILAVSPNIDGEATALYLTRMIKPFGVKVTRIACGIPAGSDIEYADEVTLIKSLEGRRDV
ncbi:MAG: recombination protein RecR [Nitrospirae bacterium]|nr:recombination protein RecR [Nitrospirota bacterium]MBI3358434.1 recombination protein RecR [Candidatus Troglogloeales bacterium]